jgi:hypothetical protein
MQRIEPEISSSSAGMNRIKFVGFGLSPSQHRVGCTPEQARV